MKLFACIAKVVIIWSIRGYSMLISPFLAPSCRFSPSCSQYAIQCIERHGVIRSIGFIAGRLLSCQPFSS